MPLIASGALPVFERVTERAALAVLICWLPKARVVVDKLAIGAGGAAPVPERLTLCGLPAAPSVIVRVPARVPRAVGVNVMLMAQPAPASSDVPQVLVWA